MIVVIATLRAKEGREQEVETLLLHLVEETRKEAGCLQYNLHRASEDPRHFAFYERWETAEALAAHFETPHFNETGGRVDELCEGEPSIVTYTVVA